MRRPNLGTTLVRGTTIKDTGRIITFDWDMRNSFLVKDLLSVRSMQALAQWFVRTGTPVLHPQYK